MGPEALIDAPVRKVELCDGSTIVALLCLEVPDLVDIDVRKAVVEADKVRHADRLTARREDFPPENLRSYLAGSKAFPSSFAA